MDTLPMSYLMDWVYRIYGLAIAYVAGCLIIRQFIIKRKINPPQIIFIFGLVVFLLAVLADFGYLPEVFLMPKYQLTGVAMLVLALCSASAIFIAAMQEREETIEARHRLSTEVAVLENLSQVKTEYYNTLHSHITEAKQARHDLRYHLSVFRSFIASGETEKLEEYISKYQDSMPDDIEVVFCENYAVNSILRYFTSITVKEGIKVDTHLELPENTGVNDSDLCIIIGNCIENAIEACRSLNGLNGEKFIKINSAILGNILSVTVDNSFDGKTFLEGVGISSVKAVAAKYDGETRFEAKGNVFQSSVMLRVKP